MSDHNVVIVSAQRTPIGAFQGVFAPVTATLKAIRRAYALSAIGGRKRANDAQGAPAVDEPLKYYLV